MNGTMEHTTGALGAGKVGMGLRTDLKNVGLVSRRVLLLLMTRAKVSIIHAIINFSFSLFFVY